MSVDQKRMSVNLQEGLITEIVPSFMEKMKLGPSLVSKGKRSATHDQNDLHS